MRKGEFESELELEGNWGVFGRWEKERKREEDIGEMSQTTGKISGSPSFVILMFLHSHCRILTSNMILRLYISNFQNYFPTYNNLLKSKICFFFQ